MNIYEQDGYNVRSNQLTIIGGSNPAYNAVLSVSFSDEETGEEIELEEAKTFCYIDGNDSDSLLEMLIPAAREICESFANLSFKKRTVEATIVNGLGNINLPYGPVIGDVTRDGATYTLNISYTDPFNVSYDAGYDELPAKLKLAWLNQIKHMFDNRGDGELSPMAKAILKPLRNV